MPLCHVDLFHVVTTMVWMSTSDDYLLSVRINGAGIAAP